MFQNHRYTIFACLLVMAFGDGANFGFGSGVLGQEKAAQNAGSVDTQTSHKIDDEGMIPTASAIGMMKQRIEKNQHDYVSMTILGQLLMRDAKERDDHQSYVAAENAYRNAIKTNADAAKAAQVHLIAALHAQHKFKSALEQSAIALQAVPGNLVAIAGQGDAQMELGDLAEAEKTFLTVADQVRTPGVLARLSRIAELKGQTAEAIKLIEQAREESVKAGEREQTTAWYDFRLGLLHFGQGNLDAAETAYRAGMVRNIEDTKSMDGLAKILVARKNFSEADKLFRRSLEIVEAPPTIAELGDLLQLLGRDEEAKKCWDQAATLMQHEAENTGVAHYRERAMFLLEHDRELMLALKLAEQDIQLRQDIYSYDTLAWALYKNERHEEAYAKSEMALSAGTRDAGLLFRAGMIAAKSGHSEEASKRLNQALQINPYFDPADMNLAIETLKRLKTSNSTLDISSSR